LKCQQARMTSHQRLPEAYGYMGANWEAFKIVNNSFHTKTETCDGRNDRHIHTKPYD